VLDVLHLARVAPATLGEIERLRRELREVRQEPPAAMTSNDASDA